MFAWVLPMQATITVLMDIQFGAWGQICQTVKLKSLPNVLCTHVCYKWEYFYEFLMFTMVATKNKLAYLFKKPNDTHSVLIKAVLKSYKICKITVLNCTSLNSYIAS